MRRKRQTALGVETQAERLRQNELAAVKPVAVGRQTHDSRIAPRCGKPDRRIAPARPAAAGHTGLETNRIAGAVARLGKDHETIAPRRADRIRASEQRAAPALGAVPHTSEKALLVVPIDILVGLEKVHHAAVVDLDRALLPDAGGGICPGILVEAHAATVATYFGRRYHTAERIGQQQPYILVVDQERTQIVDRMYPPRERRTLGTHHDIVAPVERRQSIESII